MKKQSQKNRSQHMAITVSEALGAFERAFRTGNSNEVEQLLREMLNVQVAVVDNPQEAEKIVSSGRRLRTITVPYRVFLGKFKEILQHRHENVDEPDTGVYCLEQSNIIFDDQRLTLQPVSSPDRILPGKTYVLLSSQAGYSRDKGLTFQGVGETTGFEDQPPGESREKLGSGRFQTWKAHVRGVWERSQRLANFYRPFLKSWAKNVLFAQERGNSDDARLDDFVETVLWAMRVAVLFHDIGKLRKKWQEAVWEYERLLTGRMAGDSDEERFIARTSPPPDEDKQCERPRKPHAKYAYPFVSAFLRSLLGENRFLESAIALAAARHHSVKVPGSVQSGEFELAEGAREFLQSWLPEMLELNNEERIKVLEALNKAIDSAKAGSQADEPPSPSDDFYFLYCLTNRMVRVADWEDAGQETVELPGYLEGENAAT